MKQKEVVMGGTYTTYICGVQSQVVVCGTKAPNSFSRFTRFVVRRVGESVNLPKPRSAAALHPLPPTASQTRPGLVPQPTRAHMCPPNQPTDHIGLPLSYIVPCVREQGISAEDMAKRVALSDKVIGELIEEEKLMQGGQETVNGDGMDLHRRIRAHGGVKVGPLRLIVYIGRNTLTITYKVR